MGNWTEIEISGHACDVFEPSAASEHGYVVIYLHGVHLERLVDKPAFTGAFEQYGLRAIAPCTQRSWWTDRLCEEFDPQITAERHLLDNVLPYINSRWASAPPRIALLGTSMGGQGALRFAFKYPDTFPIVAALAPAIDYQLRWQEGHEPLRQMYRDAEAVRQDTATLHVHPLYWPRNTWFACDPADVPWHESAERLRMKLAALGVPHECDLETSGGGHGFEYYNRMAGRALEFVVGSLERERTRVV
jgi:S-formylglutathione hydrolase FrmB